MEDKRKRRTSRGDVHLVYEHKCQNRQIVPGGISIMTDWQLTIAVSQFEDLIIVPIPLERGQTSFDLYKRDLLPGTNNENSSSPEGVDETEGPGDGGKNVEDTATTVVESVENGGKATRVEAKAEHEGLGKEVKGGEVKGWEIGHAPNEDEEVPWRVFLGHDWAGHSFDRILVITIDPLAATLGERAE